MPEDLSGVSPGAGSFWWATRASPILKYMPGWRANSPARSKRFIFVISPANSRPVRAGRKLSQGLRLRCTRFSMSLRKFNRGLSDEPRLPAPFDILKNPARQRHFGLIIQKLACLADIRDIAG